MLKCLNVELLVSFGSSSFAVAWKPDAQTVAIQGPSRLLASPMRGLDMLGLKSFRFREDREEVISQLFAGCGPQQLLSNPPFVGR